MITSLKDMKFYQYLNGELVKGKSQNVEVICPGTEESIYQLDMASSEQAEQALIAANAAFHTWSKLSVEEREKWMKQLYRVIEEHEETLADILSLETGKIRRFAKTEIQSLYKYLTYFLEEAKAIKGEVLRDTSNSNGHNLVVREPLGVIVANLAWNLPIHNLATKLGPVLASGCTAVIKPATKTPLSTLFIGELLHKINFPKGVLNIVAGSAEEIGHTLSSSQIPAMLTMIGSTRGGKEIIRDSTTSIKRFSLELGGNAPVIVTKHADLEAAANHCAVNKMMLAGQTCVSPQRAIIDQEVYDEFVSRVREKMNSAVFGTLNDDEANTGPMIDEKSIGRMNLFVKDALEKGAILECGGQSPESPNKGYFFSPTVLGGVNQDMRVFREEVFGPILACMPYQSINEAINLANDTEYGLSSYVWSENTREIQEIYQKLQFGIVNVNGPGTGPHLPHGGIKESGVGKDGSNYALDEYYYLKCIRVGGY